MFIRLDKYIASQRGDLSRSDVKELCQRGRVTVDGEICRKSDRKVAAGESMVAINGEIIGYKKNIYIMLNKPQGYVCATHDKDSPTVLSLVPDELFRDGLFPAGRLDKDTEGFVLITDDGEFAHNMLAPKSHVPKEYEVTLERPYEDDYAERFRDGIVIDGGEKCLPAEFIPDENNEFLCRLILHEGKFHQVKRMFFAVGNHVVHLKRTMIGKLRLDSDLKSGECLEILHKDVEKLLSH